MRESQTSSPDSLTGLSLRKSTELANLALAAESRPGISLIIPSAYCINLSAAGFRLLTSRRSGRPFTTPAASGPYAVPGHVQIMNLQLDYAASIVLFQQLLGPLDTVHEAERGKDGSKVEQPQPENPHHQASRQQRLRTLLLRSHSSIKGAIPKASPEESLVVRPAMTRRGANSSRIPHEAQTIDL
ncbi:predicted protein [Histoplasma capsulatum H143]|uniref:Uncharacterized protein n=1 Tax=Ajellomyces capsulatus (strain H143) TaxID=544712 RepID=C6HPX0_AJECH|nr:predicted protein [Histoplasma capsulatum H143]